MRGPYRGRDHRNTGILENPGCFYISKSTYGPLYAFDSIKEYKMTFKAHCTDFEVIPENKLVSIFMDLDVRTTNDVERAVFDLIEVIREELNEIQCGICVRWVGTSHKNNKKSYHVIYNGTMTLKQQKAFFHKKHAWIDTCVYSRNRLFRAFLQNKAGENRPVVDHSRFRGVSFEDRFVTYIEGSIPITYDVGPMSLPKRILPKKKITMDSFLLSLLRKIKRKKQSSCRCALERWQLYLCIFLSLFFCC